MEKRKDWGMQQTASGSWRSGQGRQDIELEFRRRFRRAACQILAGVVVIRALLPPTFGSGLEQHSATPSRFMFFAAATVQGVEAGDTVGSSEADLPNAESSPGGGGRSLTLREILEAGGIIGYLIVGLSFLMVALIADHVMNIRKTSLIPPGLAEGVHTELGKGDYPAAAAACEQAPSLLGRILQAGVAELGLSYQAIEKAMEDAAAEQSARLQRRIEYLSVIGTIAPMLGLMGTVWGMIQAFLEFEQQANPQVSELAPGIYRALVTTLLGLTVAVPSLAAFAIFRNRIDEMTAEAALLSERVFADHRRHLLSRKASRRSGEGPRPMSDSGKSA